MSLESGFTFTFQICEFTIKKWFAGIVYKKRESRVTMPADYMEENKRIHRKGEDKMNKSSKKQLTVAQVHYGTKKLTDCMASVIKVQKIS